MSAPVTGRFVKLRHHAQLPSCAHEGDAGMDLTSCEDITLPAGGSALVPTGLAIQLPPGTEAQVRPRSGLALRHQVTVLNSPGTIDEGYRGEVAVILINHGAQAFTVERGMRIAQLVIKPVLNVTVEEVHALDESSRGTGDFGSTGR
jgi:dUTP pyrophosphatase